MTGLKDEDVIEVLPPQQPEITSFYGTKEDTEEMQAILEEEERKKIEAQKATK